MFANEHLAAESLPSDVIHEIYIADQVRFFKADKMPVLVCPHRLCADEKCENPNGILRLYFHGRQFPRAARKQNRVSARA